MPHIICATYYVVHNLRNTLGDQTRPGERGECPVQLCSYFSSNVESHKVHSEFELRLFPTLARHYFDLQIFLINN